MTRLTQTPAPELILRGGRFTTLARSKPVAQAVAIQGGRFVGVGDDASVMALAGSATRVIDLHGASALPGLIDNHSHVIRGGLNYNMELRWDGVRSLADAMSMLRRQVAITPAPQWVRVVGGFTEHQFAEKRLPTIAELNAVAPDTPVFILHLYDRALLNGAALRAVGYTRDTPEPPGGQILRDADGTPTGLLLAKPNASILYATLGKGPKLPYDYQRNSTRHFMRELNRLGITGVIDAGGGSQNWPDDYKVIEDLEAAGELTLRFAYNLFTQKPKQEKQDFLDWTAPTAYKQGSDYFRHNGAGEMLVFSAADFEDFRVPRPDLPEQMEDKLEEVVRVLAQNRWPWRLHATYDETISRSLDVFERVNKDVPLAGLNWFFDHAWTENVTWFSNEEGKKGRIEVGQLADLVVPDRDFFACAEADIADITSTLTVVGGRIVYAAGRLQSEDGGALPPAMPDWSPVRSFGGYGAWGDGEGKPLQAALKRNAAGCGCDRLCGVHGHRHATAWAAELPASDARSFWGALGCACWAV